MTKHLPYIYIIAVLFGPSADSPGAIFLTDKKTKKKGEQYSPGYFFHPFFFRWLARAHFGSLARSQREGGGWLMKHKKKNPNVRVCARVCVCVYSLWYFFFTRFVYVCVARNRRRRRLCNNPKRGSLRAPAMGVMNVHSAGNITHTLCTR